MGKIKTYILFASVTAVVFTSGYFASLANAGQSVSEKQLEGVWKPVQFLKADYSIGELVDTPLQNVEGLGETYLHFKGKTLCRNGILEGPKKKLCGESSDALFREYFMTPLTRGGVQVSVWADDEKTFTIPLEVALAGEKLIETFGDGSQKTYQKVKTASTNVKKQPSLKKEKKSKKKKSSAPAKPALAKPQGTWHVVAILDGQTAAGPFVPNTIWKLSDYAFDVTLKGDAYCTTYWTDPLDDTKPHCEPLIFNADGTFTGSRLQAFDGFMQLDGSRLEFIEGGKGYTKYILEKK